MLNQKNRYNPDVLDCIANLSSDEVFTSPKLVNQMLDMLPQDLFTSPDTKFLDPCCKSGVFLREITKRLDKGLEDKIPDRQERIDHILHTQVFGIAITELTAQLSRRTLYCSKYACAIKSGNVWISDNEDTKHGIHETHSYSISEFTKEDENDFCLSAIQGNIRFNRKIKHTYLPIKDKEGNVKRDTNGKILYNPCPICGAHRDSYGDFNYAYEFIHIDEKFFEELKNMQFDVIIGNPPYQVGAKKDSDLHKTSDKPIYQDFVEQAKKLQPRYLSMIIPSRWMSAGKGLDKFRDIMIHDRHITKLVDFINEKECFSGVEIKGGVCYFLRERDISKKCTISTHTGDGSVKESERYLADSDESSYIRLPELFEIKEKVVNTKGFVGINDFVYSESSWRISNNLSVDYPKEFSKLTKSASRFFASNVFDILSDNIFLNEKPSDIENYICLYGRQQGKRTYKWIKSKYVEAPDNKDFYKIFIPKSNGSGAVGETLSTPVVGQPVVGHTQTFISIGKFSSEKEANNALKYIKCKFTRTMLSLLKITQHNKRDVWKFVPMQNFTDESDIDWSKSIKEIDAQLYKKYNLDEDDIAFIEENIQEMN